MQPLVCDLCGGKLVMKAGGVAVCDSCGMEYSADRMKEKVQEIKGTVRVDNTHMLSTYLEMAATALEAGNNEEAENYANKVIEIDPRCAKAWLYKGKAAGWQTTGRNNRYPESIVNWINAYEFAGEDEKDQITETIKKEAMNISAAILQMECNSFVNLRSEKNKDDVINALNMISKQLNTLKSKTKIDIYTKEFKTVLARTVNNCAVNATNNTVQEFGPENSNRDKFRWTRFTEAEDSCLTLLEKAYALCYDEELSDTICKNYIDIAQTVRDSCSYKYQPSAYGNGTYVKDYSFTKEAMASRTKVILQWKDKEAKHDPIKRQAAGESALAIYNSVFDQSNKQLAIQQYWEAHASEKAALETELAEIETEKARLEEQAEQNADRQQMEQFDQEIRSVSDQMRSLGFFKVKEKKALSAKRDELIASKRPYEERWNAVKQQLNTRKEELNKRNKEISDEFTKDRGPAKIAPKQYLSLFADNASIVTPLELAKYHKAVLPDGFGIKGEGNEAIENFTKTAFIGIQTIGAVLLKSLDQKESTSSIDLDYMDAPDYEKQYRIKFQSNGDDMRASLTFYGKTVDSPLTRSQLSYNFAGEQKPENVADYMRIVTAALSGICPSMDLYELAKKISEVAYGMAPETTVEADQIACTISGGTKENTVVEIRPAGNPQ